MTSKAKVYEMNIVSVPVDNSSQGLSDLLKNILDGKFEFDSDTIYIMTTNHHLLDPSLMRTPRMEIDFLRRMDIEMNIKKCGGP